MRGLLFFVCFVLLLAVTVPVEAISRVHANPKHSQAVSKHPVPVLGTHREPPSATVAPVAVLQSTSAPVSISKPALTNQARGIGRSTEVLDQIYDPTTGTYYYTDNNNNNSGELAGIIIASVFVFFLLLICGFAIADPTPPYYSVNESEYGPPPAYRTVKIVEDPAHQL
jgi:hypothetical protein